MTQRPVDLSLPPAAPNGNTLPTVTFVGDGSAQPIASELTTIERCVTTYGAAHYRWQNNPSNPSAAVATLALALGLVRHDQGVRRESDGWSVLTAQHESTNQAQTNNTPLIPYSNRPMAWHTDGYYNSIGQEVRTFILHCISPAQTGGHNSLMDTRIAVALLDQQDAHAFSNLTHPEAITVPEYRIDGLVHRPARCAPVIRVDEDGDILVRFTTRSRHIEWRDEATMKAAKLLQEIIQRRTDYHIHVGLKAGEGIVSRNSLHCRQGFEDSVQSTRKMLRARFLDQINVKDKTRGQYGRVS